MNTGTAKKGKKILHYGGSNLSLERLVSISTDLIAREEIKEATGDGCLLLLIG
jgi:hypothetical protein